ncbi:MAG TPA: hypothetical protein VLS25_00500 [Dehalococcoidia bacterium]|nr:hypothetical protein [Dehalococcoidia bacterium]
MAVRVPGLLFAVVLTAALGFLATGTSSATAPPFDPGGVMCFEAMESDARCDGDTSPGAASDIRLTFCVGWNEDCSIRDSSAKSSLATSTVMFTPLDWTAPKGDTVPTGAIAGRIEEEEFLSLLNNPCNNRLTPGFTLLNASINVSDTVEPRPVGQTDVMLPLATDINGNGIPDGADHYPKFLADFFSANGAPMQPRERLFGITDIAGSWIAMNILVFDPGQTVEIGQTVITFNAERGYPAVAVLQDPTLPDAVSPVTDSCSPFLMDLVVMGRTLDNPCTPVAVVGANCPIRTENDTSEIMSVVGEPYPSLPCSPRSSFDDDGDGVINDGCPLVGATAETGAECNNDVSDDVEDSSVNDGCPQVGAVSEGSRVPGACTSADEGGCTYRANPAAAGAQKFTLLALSGRDLDGDGIDNSLDVCFDKANPEWNPRAVDPANDTDMDGIPNVCDPNPNQVAPGSPVGCKSGYTGADEDQDCIANRADSCFKDSDLKDPTKPADNFPETFTNPPIVKDKDGDGIGDVCDPHPDQVDGDYTGVCLDFEIDVAGAGGPVTGVKESAPVPACVEGVHGDGPYTPTPTPSPTATPEPRFLTCSVNGPITGPAATPTELSTFTSDAVVYATLSGSTSTTGQTISFSDEPGLGGVDIRNVVTGSDGVAQTTYRLPADLSGQAVATVTARRGADVCSVSFLIKPPPAPIVLPRAGGDAASGPSGAWVALAGVVIGLAGAAALVAARRRVALGASSAGRGTRSGAVVVAGLIAIGAAVMLSWRRLRR